MQGLKGLDGELIDAPEGFRRLKVRQPLGTTDGAQVELRYQNEIFPELRRAGLELEQLQLAWDFTTGSAEWQTRDILDAHDAAAAVNAVDTPVIEIVGTDSTGDDRMAHLVHGTIRVPSVLDGEGPGSPLLRNEEGRVIASGFATYPFVVVIPKSALSVKTLRLYYISATDSLQAQRSFRRAVRNIAHESKSVVFAVDWIGMAEDDIGLLCESVSRHLWRTLAATDRIPQAMVNWSTLTAALDSAFNDEPLFSASRAGRSDFQSRRSELSWYQHGLYLRYCLQCD